MEVVCIVVCYMAIEERKLVDTSVQAEMRMSRWMGGIEVTGRLTCS